MKRVAVIGGGWAGLATAVAATRNGHRVTVYEMAPRLGGRARSLTGDEGAAQGERGLTSHSTAGPPAFPLDNGQHILIGAYAATLNLLREVGVDAAAAFHRSPLALVDPAGHGLRLPAGAALPAFARAVLSMQSWSWRERLQLLATASGWLARGFRCPPGADSRGPCVGTWARPRGTS